MARRDSSRQFVIALAEILDVILIDKQNCPVVVECKQHAPSTNDIKQLRHYMKKLKQETGDTSRGILVHGGAQTISADVIAEAKKTPPVEIVSYSLEVNFRPWHAID